MTGSQGTEPPPAAAAPADPLAALRSNAYLKLLLLAGIVGIPISALAYGYLELVAQLQEAVFTDIPKDLGFGSTPAWWPLPVLFLCGLLVAAAITYLPGIGGHSPADGFKAGGVTAPIELPGIFLASLATLGLGAVLGPEAPLILMGSGLGALAVRLAARDSPPTATAIMAAAGSFAAISALFGSPLLGAFLLLEAAGLGGAQVTIVLMPGLLSAGVGALVFVGLDDWTGFGSQSFAIPGLPPFAHPTLAMFGWAIVFGLAAALLGKLIRSTALAVRPHVERRMLILMPVLGLMIGGAAVVFEQATDKGYDQVLFSGQSAVGPLVEQPAAWSTGALLLVILCKSFAYSLSLSAFRGGPVFPSLFIGAAIGVAAADLPGLELVPAVAMGIGALATVMLRLPLTSVLLATLLLLSDGLQAMPLVIVAVVVAQVAATRLDGPPDDDAAEPAPATATPAAPVAA